MYEIEKKISYMQSLKLNSFLFSILIYLIIEIALFWILKVMLSQSYLESPNYLDWAYFFYFPNKKLYFYFFLIFFVSTWLYFLALDLLFGVKTLKNENIIR